MNYGGYGDNNYSTNTYGGGGAGGGGFVNNYGGSQGGGSQQTPGSASKARGANTLRPVTIKQILEASQPHPDAEFKIDDVDISHITFVAQIRNVSEQATCINYRMDDGTGVMEVKHWGVDLDSVTDDSPLRLVANQYVRVLGGLKLFDGKRHVGAHQIYPITDFNEVHYHLLEATAIHLHFTRGPPEQFATEATTSYGQPGNFKGERDTAMGGMGGMGGGASSCPPGASPVARRVFETIKASPHNNDGIHTNIISQKSGMSMSDVMMAVDELVKLGFAYTTTDDSHIAVMDF